MVGELSVAEPSLESLARSATISRKLEAEDMSFVFDQLLYKSAIDEEDVLVLEREFKRFFLLVGLSNKPMAMIGPLIDEIWHQFIVFTEKYDKFCRDSVGFFVHHRPDTSETPVPQEAGENFLQAYEQRFGQLPPIWWKGMDVKTRAFYQARPLRDRPPTRWSGWTGER